MTELPVFALGEGSVKSCVSVRRSLGKVTELTKAGVPMKARQERLGNTNAEITVNLYTHPVAQADRAFAEWIGNELTVGTHGPN